MLPNANPSRQGSGRQSRPRQRRPPASSDPRASQSSTPREPDSPNQATRSTPPIVKVTPSHSSGAQGQESSKSSNDGSSKASTSKYGTLSERKDPVRQRRYAIPMKTTASHLSPRKSPIKRQYTWPPTTRNRASASGVTITEINDDDESTSPITYEQSPNTSGTQHQGPVGEPPEEHLTQDSPPTKFGSQTAGPSSAAGPSDEKREAQPTPPPPPLYPVFRFGSETAKPTSSVDPPSKKQEEQPPIPPQIPVFRFGSETAQTTSIAPPGEKREEQPPIPLGYPVSRFGSGTAAPTSSIETGADSRAVPDEQMMDTDIKPSEMSMHVHPGERSEEQPSIPDNVFRFGSQAAGTSSSVYPSGEKLWVQPPIPPVYPVFKFGSESAAPTSSFDTGADRRPIPNEQLMDTDMRSSELSIRASISNISMQDAFEEAPPERVSPEFLHPSPDMSLFSSLPEMTSSSYEMDTATPFQPQSVFNFDINAPSATFGNYVRFSPVFGEDYLEENDMVYTVPTRIQCITAMAYYADRSFEELRWQDYHIGRRGPATTSGNLPAHHHPYGSSGTRDTFYSYEPSLAPLYQAGTSAASSSPLQQVAVETQQQLAQLNQSFLNTTPTPSEFNQSIYNASTAPVTPQFNDSFFSDSGSIPATPSKVVELSRSSSYTAFARTLTKKWKSFFQSQETAPASTPCAQESRTRITHDSVSFPTPSNLSQFLYAPSTSRAPAPSFFAQSPVSMDVSHEMSMLLKSAAKKMQRTRATLLQESKSLVDELIDFRLEYTSYRRLCITRRPEPRYEVHPIGEETPDYGPELVPIFDKEIPPTPAPSVATLILDPPTEEEKARDRLCQKLSEFSDDEESLTELKPTNSESSTSTEESSSSTQTICFIPSHLSTIPEEDEDAYISTPTTSDHSIAITEETVEERTITPPNVIRVSSTDLLISPEQCEELNRIRRQQNQIAEERESDSDSTPRVIDEMVGEQIVSSTTDIATVAQKTDESKVVRVLFESRLCRNESVASTSGIVTQEWDDDSSEESYNGD